MGATAGQIATYLTNIQNAQTVYMNSVIVKERLGFPNVFEERVRATVLTAYIDIMAEYFSEPVYAGGIFLLTNNFYDEEEAEDVMLRINKLCDTNYYVDL